MFVFINVDGSDQHASAFQRAEHHCESEILGTEIVVEVSLQLFNRKNLNQAVLVQVVGDD